MKQKAQHSGTSGATAAHHRLAAFIAHMMKRRAYCAAWRSPSQKHRSTGVTGNRGRRRINAWRHHRRHVGRGETLIAEMPPSSYRRNRNIGPSSILAPIDKLTRPSWQSWQKPVGVKADGPRPNEERLPFRPSMHGPPLPIARNISTSNRRQWRKAQYYCKL